MSLHEKFIGITKDQLVDLGYTDLEPSVSYLAYCYYKQFFTHEEAKQKASAYCEKFEEILSKVKS